MKAVGTSLFLLLIVNSENIASATVTMQDVRITNPNGSGNIVCQLLIDFDNQLGTSQLCFVLSAGSFIGTGLADNPVTPKGLQNNKLPNSVQSNFISRVVFHSSTHHGTRFV